MRLWLVAAIQHVASVDVRHVVEQSDRIRAIARLHDRLRAYVAPDMTFEQLHAQANRWIADSGYRNADFLGNLGHSIATAKRKRIYIERGNRARLDSVRYFTFEPHIVPLGGVYGFKREDIYYFSDGVLQTL